MAGIERANGHRPTGLLHLLDPTLKLAPHPQPENYDFDLFKSLDSVHRLTSEVPEDAFSAQTLGTEREGNAVLISEEGLLLTIGYLVIDARSITIKSYGGEPVQAELVGYNHESGMAIIHALAPLPVKPIEIGSAENLTKKDPVIIASYGGEHHSIAAEVASRREFAGSWEYMLDNAIFTTPIHPNWSGAALIDNDGKLCGLGSLWVNDAEKARQDMSLESLDKTQKSRQKDSPGNMFVPIDLLKPIYDDLISTGIAGGEQRPWLGMYTAEAMNRLFVSGVIPDAPADLAEVEPGDLIVGINDQDVPNLPAMYRLLWSLGPAGVEITLNLRRDGEDIDIVVTSDSRYSFMERRKNH
ncbi:MAG: serine protease [Rhodospirillaceae bacterium]|jgi:S1-C subfamily serine protease|nr:serine protease [Rhodospirillaceae bacterium]MBT5941886.1 serine protease [Rhodospirillaceae bacterium]MBT7267621.1 serine protease [Rhodospirillaceae bacterium]